MQILFVHRNFPAQFGHIARHLIEKHNYRCTFVSEKPEGQLAGVTRLQYQTKGGAALSNNYWSRTFENQMWASQAILECLEQHPEVRPDLVVSHSGFFSSTCLRELYECPIINYFEYFYRTAGGDLDFRYDLPQCTRSDRVRARARNATLLLDLENCDAGYSATRWQHSRLPQEFQPKVATIFDGIETDFWRPFDTEEPIPELEIPADVRVVTYCSRGLESMRGFDIFMKAAKRIGELRSDVIFLVIGDDRVVYGGDLRFTNGTSFKHWVLNQDDYDLNRILFLGRVPPRTLARIFNRSDLHIYLTVPFVLSWSLMNALACGATVLASDTAPVREMVQHRQNGLLVDFFDLDGMVSQAIEVLDDPPSYKHLGKNGADIIRERYSIDVCLPKMVSLYQRIHRQCNSPYDALD